MDSKTRLFVNQPLVEGQSVSLGEKQAHYLYKVMRKEVGSNILLFNGKSGEWVSRISDLGKNYGCLNCIEKTNEQSNPPNLWLLFSPLKKTRTDFVVEKATEMGVAKIVPISTDFTSASRIKKERLQSHAIEAAEQCGATYVPTVTPLENLDHKLSNWPADRYLLFCDEKKIGHPVDTQNLPFGKWAVLIGPEGGFSDRERLLIKTQPNAIPFSLGPRILRADTAVVAALAILQKNVGDWK